MNSAEIIEKNTKRYIIYKVLHILNKYNVSDNVLKEIENILND